MQAFLDDTDAEQHEFNRVLLSVIDESLNQILGENSTRFIYSFLEKHNLRKEDIPDNLEELHYVLKKIFDLGAYVIEKVIIEKLYSRRSPDKKIEIKYESPEQFNLAIYVKSLKKIALLPQKDGFQSRNNTNTETLTSWDLMETQNEVRQGDDAKRRDEFWILKKKISLRKSKRSCAE